MAVTIVTRAHLKDGSTDEWDEAMRERVSEAHTAPGWISGRLLASLDEPNGRTIVGTWERREDWEAWHDDEEFRETRTRLEGLQAQPDEVTWYEVMLDKHR
jgi:heme-degrading monooxygenase HmoA